MLAQPAPDPLVTRVLLAGPVQELDSLQRKTRAQKSDSQALGVKSCTSLGTEGTVTHRNAPNTTREGRRAKEEGEELLEPSTSPCSSYACTCYATSLREAFGHKVTTRGTNRGSHRRECPCGQGPAGPLAPLPCSKEGCPP